MELQSSLKLKFNLISSTIPTRILKAGLYTNSRLLNFKIQSKAISDSDPIADRDYVHKNKVFYIFNLKLFPAQKYSSVLQYME